MAQKFSLFPENENDLFFFESDQLALRGNKDYCEVLKSLVVLSAQREKLIKDYKKVIEIKKQVLQNPVGFVEKIANKEDLGLELPDTVELAKLPVVNFDKYEVTVPQSELRLIYSENSQDTNVEEDLKRERRDSRVSFLGMMFWHLFDITDMIFKAWSIEEQKRLEELLRLYPPEPIERKRYQKIAKALGNRTLKQVTSRVQKYFLKLYKAGLPIPGRIPKCVEKHNRVMHKHQRLNHFLWKPSTFFPEFNTPVVMDDLESTPGPSMSEPPPPPCSSNYLLESEYLQSSSIQDKSDEESQLQLINRVKEEKLREREDPNALFRHLLFTCDFCNARPIVGARWHCTTCKESKDYCTDCILSQMLSEKRHPLSHVFAVVRNDAEGYSLPQSDSESYSGSGVTSKRFESDSSGSEESDEEDGSNSENPIKAETENSMDTDMGQDYNFDDDNNYN
ncbi:ada2a-containing complex component 1 isoform X2 [Leptinotarsa decemlineata]|uniref:ada2a-containing complex component 1 isoform X2 n=1 Tax=Leptinotarsa decemlineata TaxID=7539 RepID=UPI003D308EE5